MAAGRMQIRYKGNVLLVLRLQLRVYYLHIGPEKASKISQSQLIDGYRSIYSSFLW